MVKRLESFRNFESVKPLNDGSVNPPGRNYKKSDSSLRRAKEIWIDTAPPFSKVIFARAF